MKKTLISVLLLASVLLSACGGVSGQNSKAPEATPAPIVTEAPIKVTIQGKEYGQETQSLDLSGITPGEVADIAAKISKLENLEDIELMDAGGASALSWADFSAIAKAAPKASVHYSNDLYGLTLDTISTERLEYKKIHVSDEGLEEFREILPYVKGLKYLSFDRCETSDEACASLRDDFPATEVVWRVYYGPFTCMTDEVTIWASCDLTDDNCTALKYCTKLKNLDIGHDPITKLDFLDYMPDLEVLIISGDDMTEIEHVASCKNLKFLEVAECTKLTDISPIAEIEYLEHVNVGGCLALTDLSPLYGLKHLKRMYAPNLFQTCLNMTEEREKFEELMPNTEIDCGWYADGAAVGTWRFTQGAWTGSYVEEYQKIRDIFGYDYMDNSPYRMRPQFLD